MLNKHYINLDKSMMYNTITKDLTLVSCTGRKVQFEILEHNHIKVNDRIYKMGPTYIELTEVEEVKTIDDFDTQVQCEEYYNGTMLSDILELNEDCIREVQS